jgi:hypothetical protein
MEPDEIAEPEELELDYPKIIEQVKALQSSIETLRNEAAYLADLAGVGGWLVNCHDRLLEAKAWAGYAVSAIETHVNVQVGFIDGRGNEEHNA